MSVVDCLSGDAPNIDANIEACSMLRLKVNSSFANCSPYLGLFAWIEVKKIRFMTPGDYQCVSRTNRICIEEGDYNLARESQALLRLNFVAKHA
jgi:hypothetical protein